MPRIDWLSCRVSPRSQGALTLVAKTLVPRWFIRKRGKAMGLLSLGWLLGQATIPSISTYIIKEHGWRECWMFWGMVCSL